MSNISDIGENHLAACPPEIFDRDLLTTYPFLREALRNRILIKGTEHLAERGVR